MYIKQCHSRELHTLIKVKKIISLYIYKNSVKENFNYNK
jgi:hypothetical protein